MKVVYFVHAIGSCWNNGNAHFLRGVGRELQRRGHEVLFLEPENGWSEANLLRDAGPQALDGFARAYPDLNRRKYNVADCDLEALTDAADLVIAHEWNEPALVNGLAKLRRRGAPFKLLFHDTHHRALSQRDAMQCFDLDGYDGVLTFGAVLTAMYERLGWGKSVWTWHEAADTTVFYPRASNEKAADVVWIGNWGDGERTAELETFFLNPAHGIGVRANIYGVRYPQHAIESLNSRGFSYCNWLPNHAVPEAFARHRMTVHVPRRPYAESLPGIPTIRVFEALACGIPLISAPWTDAERLFPESCFLMAHNVDEMPAKMRAVLSDDGLCTDLRNAGLTAIRDRHSCTHRVTELLGIYRQVKGDWKRPMQRSEAA